MPIQSYDKFMLPLLKAISDGRVYNNQETFEGLRIKLGYTDDDMQIKVKSGLPVVYDRIGWAKAYLKQAGLIENLGKGEFRITSEGEFLANDNSVIEIDVKYLMKYPSFQEFKKKHKTPKTEGTSGEGTNHSPVKTPTEVMETAHAEMMENLNDELLERLKKIDSFRFEDIVLDLLIEMGYGGSKIEAAKATKKTGDEGIDGIINEDKLGLDRVYVQAKRWGTSSVGRPEIQKFLGALVGQGAKKGIFITTSTFTKDAWHTVEKTSDVKIVLIDGIQLAKYMTDLNVGVSVETNYEVKKINSDYFDIIP